jgi:hypothetical protein
VSALRPNHAVEYVVEHNAKVDRGLERARNAAQLIHRCRGGSLMTPVATVAGKHHIAGNLVAPCLRGDLSRNRPATASVSPGAIRRLRTVSPLYHLGSQRIWGKIGTSTSHELMSSCPSQTASYATARSWVTATRGRSIARPPSNLAVYSVRSVLR